LPKNHNDGILRNSNKYFHQQSSPSGASLSAAQCESQTCAAGIAKPTAKFTGASIVVLPLAVDLQRATTACKNADTHQWKH